MKVHVSKNLAHAEVQNHNVAQLTLPRVILQLSSSVSGDVAHFILADLIQLGLPVAEAHVTWYNSKFSSVSLLSNHPYSMNLTGCVMCQCPSLCPMWSPHPGWRLLWAAHCSQLSPSAGGQSGAACRALQAGPPGGAQHAALQHCPHTTEVLLPACFVLFSVTKSEYLQ